MTEALPAILPQLEIHGPQGKLPAFAVGADISVYSNGLLLTKLSTFFHRFDIRRDRYDLLILFLFQRDLKSPEIHTINALEELRFEVESSSQVHIWVRQSTFPANLLLPVIYNYLILY